MQLVLDEQGILESSIKRRKTGRKIGLLGSLFGCWHKNLSRPFTLDKESYCTCLDCGARRHFNTHTLETYGSFYYPPDVSLRK
jgi:hypothetical protein